MKELYVASIICLIGIHIAFAQNSLYDVRMLVSGANLDSNHVYVDIEIRAAQAGNEFMMGDQNYKFTYNRNAICDPVIYQELGFSQAAGAAVGQNWAYSNHSTSSSVDPGFGNIGLTSITIAWLPLQPGVRVMSNAWTPVTRVKFDIIDPAFAECMDLDMIDKASLLNYTNITEVDSFPELGSAQGLTPFATTSEIPEGNLISPGEIGTGPITCLNELASAFPVEWTYFHAVREGPHAVLDWGVGEEKNNSTFEVMRSVDGSLFEKVGVVKGGGNTTQAKSYEYVDPNVVDLETQRLYYKIKQVDLDGTFTYSKIIALTIDKDFRMELEVFPVPVSEILTVAFTSNGTSDVAIHISNPIGQILFSEKTENAAFQYEINVNKWPAGVYYVKAFNDGYSRVSRVVVK